MRSMSQPKARFFLARHEHVPNTKVSGSGCPEHDVGLVLGCDLSP
jgi:hypothetical protein